MYSIWQQTTEEMRNTLVLEYCQVKTKQSIRGHTLVHIKPKHQRNVKGTSVLRAGKRLPFELYIHTK